jgi:hypothetical protein
MREWMNLVEGRKEDQAALDGADNIWGKIEEMMGERGFEPLPSNGTKAFLYVKKGYPFILKVFRNDPAYEAYLNFLATNPSPFYVKVRGKPQTLTMTGGRGGFRVVRLEPLEKNLKAMELYYHAAEAWAKKQYWESQSQEEIPDDEDNVAKFLRMMKTGSEDNSGVEAKLAEVAADVEALGNPEFVQALWNIYDNIVGPTVNIDTNMQNCMMRADGTPVIIDPVQTKI